MSDTTREIAYLVDMLPERDQCLAYEIIKKMVLAWDPDFTRLTADEKKKIETAEAEINNGDYVTHSQIEWNI